MNLKIGIAAEALPPTMDGISNAVNNYANYICKNHGEAVVLTPKNPIQDGYDYPYEVYRYRSWIYPPMLKEGYRIGWPFKDYIREEVRALHCDLYHSHCPLSSSYIIKLALLKQKVPYVLTYHTKYEYDIEKRLPTKWIKNFAKNFICKLITLADEVWVTSEGTGESLKKMGYHGDFVVMPNGVDLTKGRSTQNQIEAFSVAYGIRPDTPTFLFVGRMMWYKNISILLEACDILKKQGLAFQLVMAGGGPDISSIRRCVHKLGLTNQILFVGKIEQREALRACYSAADLFLFPSTFDTNGLVVREAAACMCPSVLVRGSCASEGITDDFTGFLCDETASSLADTMKKVVATPLHAKEVGKNAFDHIYLSWEEAVATAYARYEKICSNFTYENK